MSSFYQSSIGLDVLSKDGSVERLGAEATIVELEHAPTAPIRPRGTTGLFHLAILVPSRADLARSIRRVADSGWSFSGASDHLVSEAFYLNDPEGNGIELYRDRPREEWPVNEGRLVMDSLPVDLDGIMDEVDAGDSAARVPATTRMGHVHLQVADLNEAEHFYCDILGFDVSVRGYPGALFVSAGGYHHHIGLNTWAGSGAPPPPSGSLGLVLFEVVVPTSDEIEHIEKRLLDEGVSFTKGAGGITTSDPSNNGVSIVAKA